jgi:predicted transcriptional regulator
MANVKTAISLQKTLFEQVEALARDMKVSRSRVFVLALENFVRDYQDKQLFDKINKACADAPPDQAEQLRLRQIRRQQRRIVEGERPYV